MWKALKKKTFPVLQCLSLDLPWWCLVAAVVPDKLEWGVETLWILSGDWAHVRIPPAKDFHRLPVVDPPVEGRKSRGHFPFPWSPQPKESSNP